MISTGSIVGAGKAYENFMVDVQQTNEKLVTRAQNITMDATGCNRETAKKTLAAAGGHAKLAIVPIAANRDAQEEKTP
jgi:N-acetylmuramic acid 6-phosphate etherase